MNTDETFISNFEDDLDLINEDVEVLNEDTLYRPKNLRHNDFRIGVFGDGKTNREFAKDPYFKVFKGNSNTPFCRIGFKDGKLKYIDHNNENGRFNSRERKELDDIMNKPSTDTNKYPNCTVWEAILLSTIQYASGDDIEKIKKYPKPNFKKDLRNGE